MQNLIALTLITQKENTHTHKKEWVHRANIMIISFALNWYNTKKTQNKYLMYVYLQIFTGEDRLYSTFYVLNVKLIQCKFIIYVYVN